jgi:peptidoglycan hydrolase CwlO-like protein
MELNKKYISVIVPILLSISIGLNIYLLFSDSREDKIQKSTIVQQLDSINNKIDSIKSINTHISDTINNYETKIYNANKEYEKNYSNILTQPVDSDCIFFADYLSSNFK